jgi:hypothetical protein
MPWEMEWIGGVIHSRVNNRKEESVEKESVEKESINPQEGQKKYNLESSCSIENWFLVHAIMDGSVVSTLEM